MWFQTYCLQICNLKMERKPNEPEEAVCGEMLLFLYSPELG